MRRKEPRMKKAISMSVKPVILGSEKLSSKLAFLLFIKYWLISCVFDEKIGFLSKINIFSSCRMLSSSYDDRFILMNLERFVVEHEEWATFLLIPTTERYKDFVERNREKLESKFIIRFPEQIMSKGELFPLKCTNLRKDL